MNFIAGYEVKPRYVQPARAFAFARRNTLHGRMQKFRDLVGVSFRSLRHFSPIERRSLYRVRVFFPVLSFFFSFFFVSSSAEIRQNYVGSIQIKFTRLIVIGLSATPRFFFISFSSFFNDRTLACLCDCERPR